MLSGLLDGFVNPLLALGIGLASVPLIIHLLNRQRFKPMPWAAMRFVLAAYRRTRRRARLENLLLLLLRMAAVALLALAVARPYTGSESPLALLTESRRDLVLVLDGSASTTYREQVRTTFEDVTDRAREILLELDGGRGDTVRLILAGSWPRLLSWRTPDEALSLLNALGEPTDEMLDLAAALGEVVRLAEEDAAGTDRSSLEVRLLGDLQAVSFAPETAPIPEDAGPDGSTGEAGRPLLTEQLDRLHELGVVVRIEDLGPRQATPPNLGVASIDVPTPLLGPGVPADVTVTVANHGPSLRSGVRVTLSVDGERRPYKRVDVPARSSAKVVFSIAFTRSGAHTLEARCEGDRLAIDDVRMRVISVPPPVRVLLVNGAPHPEIEKDEVGFLGAVLEPPGGDTLPGGEEATPFRVRVVDPGTLTEDDFDWQDWDVVFLANVSRLTERTAARLEEWVAGGGALAISVGDELDPDAWNERLYRADGSGLLPAELVRRVAVASRRQSYFRVQSFQEEHPALSFFADERWKPLLTEVPVYEFVSSRPLENAQVLARLDDDGQSPLLVERSYDRGLVLLWLTTIDPAWTRLPESPRTLVPLVHELVRHASAPRTPSRNVAVGAPLQAEVRGYPRSLSLARPDGSRMAVDEEPLALGSNLWRLPTVRDTTRAGLYSIEMEGAESIAFAVQIDSREGDLQRLDPGVLATLHPALHTVLRDEGGGASVDPEQPAKGELWRWLAGACLVALVLESLWAAFIGRKRNRLPA